MVCKPRNSPVPARSACFPQQCAGAPEKTPKHRAPRQSSLRETRWSHVETRVVCRRPSAPQRTCRLIASLETPTSTPLSAETTHRPTSGGHPPQLLTHSRVVVPTTADPAGPAPWPPHRPPTSLPRRAPRAMGLAVWTRELFQTWGLAPEDDRAARPETCVFCKKSRRRKPLGVCVRRRGDRRVPGLEAAARAHFLVCPREHITSARALTPADAGLARRMLEVGERASSVTRRKTRRRRARFERRDDPVRVPPPAVQQRGPPAHARVRAPVRARVEGAQIQRRAVGAVRVRARRRNRPTAGARQTRDAEVVIRKDANYARALNIMYLLRDSS